jgi:lysophospholipase L1-like esterase
VSVSLHVERPTPFATVHQLAPGASWRVPGDAVLQPAWPSAAPSAWNHIVTGLDASSPGPPARVVVAFGDSITEGAGLSADPGRPQRYPERLAARLGRAGGRFAVVNAGISGNRLLADWIGPKGVDRFERDALGQSGVTHVVVLIGINDIGFSLPEGASGGPVEGQPSAAELIAGLQRISEEAHARGVKVLLGTLLPFKGAATWNREKEHRRQLVNRWIRGRRMVDGLIDFDAALRDPKHPQALRPMFDSGDHLHPGETGTAAMANAIDLQLLTR